MGSVGGWPFGGARKMGGGLQNFLGPIPANMNIFLNFSAQAHSIGTLFDLI